jgi:hypothetical protein
LYGKTKEKFYITAVLEFGTHLDSKNRIIDASLYGMKTSSERFYEYLVESLLGLDFKKIKDDPDLWMIDKSTHYKC